MTGSNRRPSACKADALPAELILQNRMILYNFKYVKHCLAASYSDGTSVQLPSALESLTTVFGMGTGVASPPSLPDNVPVDYISCHHILWNVHLCRSYHQYPRTSSIYIQNRIEAKPIKQVSKPLHCTNLLISSREISIRPLNMLSYVHDEPIYLIISEGSIGEISS